MGFKRLGAALAAAALLATLSVGLIQLAGHSHTADSSLTTLSGAQMRAQLAGSPVQLAALHAQGGALLAGGAAVFRSRLHALRGSPIVVNKWASWCQPCRAELHVFQHASTDFGRRVAFLGIDSEDSTRSDPLALLRSVPVSYPSYFDPSGRLGAQVTDSPFMPVTVFYNSRGKQYIQQGPYLQLALLERDIRRYALAG